MITECPEGIGGFGATIAPPWVAPTGGSPDILNVCALDLACDVPANGYGYQNPITGVGYAGIWCKLPAYEYREYLHAPLTEPLLADTWYHVTIYVSLSNGSCPIETIGAYFSTNAINETHQEALDFIPQVEYLGGFMADSVNWIPIAGCFQAQGGEAFITIGNFHHDADNPVDPDCNFNQSYYYVEDILVEEGPPSEELPLELGDPVIACNEYEINPEVTEYFLIWEDGSHGPTLTVTESGIYSLTITDGCNFGEDSIEVTIIGNIEPIDIGPPTLTLCTGDEYDITLDPDLSEYTWQDGSNDPEYTITTSGVYSVTLDDGCNEYTDQIEVAFLDPPLPIDLGDDIDLCSNEEILLELDPSLGTFVWQDGSMGSSFLVTYGGVYSVTVSNECGDEGDEITITTLDVPVVNIGPDEHTMCAGEEYVIVIDPALGDILWQDASTASEYEINNAGLYTLFISNECGTGSGQVEVIVNEPPVVDLGPDTVVCGSGMVVLTTDAESGSYVWQDNSQNDSLIVTSPGLYAITVTNFCGDVSDNIVVDFIPLVNPFDLGPDISLCPGEELVLHANHQNGDYLWQDGSVADTFHVNSAGSYYAVLSNACSSVTDTINVSVNNSPPSVDLPPQLSLCQGQSITLDAGIGGVNYLWNDNSLNQQLVVASPGTYSLTVSNVCGTDRDTVIILDGGLAPAVDLGNDIQICPGEHELLVPSFSNVDTWLWHDGSSIPSFDVVSAGLITVEVGNACGSSFDTLLVDLLPATPPLDLGPDTSLCSWQTFTLTIQTPGVSVLWADGSTAPNFIVSSPGEVAASISNSCGTSHDTVTITALPDVPTLDLGEDQSLCPGEIINVSPGILNVDYAWHNGSSSNTYQSTQQESIILIITNDCGSSTDTLEIIESTQGPQVNLGPDVQDCEGTVITIPSGISGVNYLWQDGSTDPDFTTTQSGMFILQVSNNCGADVDTINVDISGVPPAVSLGPDTTLCEGITLRLTSDADAITTIEWQDGSSASSFIVSSPGIFTLTESNRCGEASDTIVVSFLDAPDPFTLGPDTTLCPGEFITLTAPASTFNIEWQDGSILEFIVADQPIMYSLQLSNDCGSVSDEIILSYDTQVPVLDLGTDLEWCEGDIIILDASQAFNASYTWNNGSISPSIEITTPGVYSVDVSTACSIVSEEINVVPGIDCSVLESHKEIYIPNVFSPNGDGINDVFVIGLGSDLDVQSMHGSIFDRWGNLVFSSNALPFSWDGYFNDKSMMPGVYVYTIKIKYVDQGAERDVLFAGDVTLLR